MKIQKIIIKNFRSIEHTELDISDFNIFVGQNNSGKTNFFEAIEFFFNGISKKSGSDINNLKYKMNSNSDMFVEIEFSGAQDGVNKMKNEKNRTIMQAHLKGNDNIILRRFNTEKSRDIMIDGERVKHKTGIDQALNDFLPKFEYIHTKQNPDSYAKNGKGTPIGIMLAGVLSMILEEDEQYKNFQDKFQDLFENKNSAVKLKFDEVSNKVKSFLEKQFSDCNKVKFEVSVPIFDDLLKNFDTSIDDGVETLAEEKGDGMQRALMLAIIQAYAEYRKSYDESNKSFLFFIDEAELHLHPTAQRNLKTVLYDLSKEMDQVFINTHSSVFVVDDENQQKIFKVEKHDGATTINQISILEKPYVIFELLGGSPADLLLPRNFLIVEGKTEFELLTKIIEKFYSDKPKIHIITACGDIDQAERTMNFIDKAFSVLNSSIYKEKTILLLDKPHEKKVASFKEFKKKYPHLKSNSQIFILEKTSIEECYPDRKCDIYPPNWQKSEDEVKNMNNKKKIKLAKYIGEQITQDEFQTNLHICYQALLQTWELSYGNKCLS